MKRLMLSLVLGLFLVSFAIAETTCEDPDDLDYFIASETVVTTNDSFTLTISDGCLSDITSFLENDTSGIIQTLVDNMISEGLITQNMINNDKILLEGQCVDTTNIDLNSNDMFLFQIVYECPNGCSAGACLTADEEEDNNDSQRRRGIGQIIRRRVRAGIYTNEDGDQIRVRELAQNRLSFKYNNDPVEAETELELEEETENNKTKLKVRLSNGRNITIKIMPGVAAQRALERLRLKICSEDNNCVIELKEVGKGINAKVAYEVQIERHSRILGIFSKKMEVKAQVDAETGEIIKVKKPWWAFLATEPAETDGGNESPDYNTLCTGVGGEWLPEHNECASDSGSADIEGFCTQYGGGYEQCESACRHSADAETCIDVCVKVCSL